MGKKRTSAVAAVVLALLFTGCARPFAEWDEERIEVTFRTGLAVSSEDMPMSRALADNIVTLQVFDCMDGEKVQEISQTSEDEHFGTVTLALTVGKHELMFVGSKSGIGTFSYPDISYGKVLDTFSYCLALDMGNEELDTDQEVSLSRRVGMVKVAASDAIPTGADALRMTLSAAYPVLNLKTSEAAGEAQEVVRTFEFLPSHIGTTGNTFSIYTFLPDEGMTTDVKVEVLDADGNVLCTSSATGVSVERNRQTILTGNVFGGSVSMNLQVEAPWGENITDTI